MDRALLLFLSWGLFLIVLIALKDPISAIYYSFCWIVTGFIDRKLLRVEREETLQRAGLSEEQVDLRMLPRDRLVAVLRGVFALAVAIAFHYYA